MKPNKITIHHEAGNAGFESVNEYHKQKWNFKSSLGFYIGYHYYIEKSGKIFQGRQDNEEGAHTFKYNTGNIGICLQGDFMTEEPSEAQIKSLKELTDRLKLTYGIQEVKAHRDYNKTECPGDELYKFVLEEKISWLKKLIYLLLNKK